MCGSAFLQCVWLCIAVWLCIVVWLCMVVGVTALVVVIPRINQIIVGLNLHKG